MVYSMETIIILVISITLIIALYFVFRNREKRLHTEIENLKSEINTKNNIITKYKTTDKEESIHQSGSSFITEQLQKIRRLEGEIELQKQRLEDAKKIAQEANMVKYDFLSNIRHEIRTPLNSILTFSNILKEEIKDTKLLSYAQNIYNSGHKMLNMMDDIIELSKIESGSFEIHENAVDVRMIFQNIFNKQRHSALEKRIDISIHIDDNLPNILIVDDVKLTDIVTNLISNAIKFTNKGYIKIDIGAKNIDESKNTLTLYVRVEDTGIGVAKEDFEKIFEIFEKKEDGTDKEYQSIGLGLSINKKMAKLMHGDIYLKSEVSKGSTFTLEVNDVEIALIEKHDEDNYIDFSLLSKKSNIMIIDSDVISAETIKQSFKDTSVNVFSFTNLRDSIESFKTNHFDVIFIDADILVADDNAVSKVISRVSSAPIITLVKGRVKDISFENNIINIVGHIKKPIVLSELFKVSIKVLNSSAYMDIIGQMSDKSDDLYSLDINKVEEFLSIQAKKIKPLHEKAVLTNDLNVMKQFCSELLSEAKNYGIVPLVEYANIFLEKIELFDIETINTLIKEYDMAIEKLQRLKKK